MSDVPSTDRSREAGIAQAAAVAFIGAYSVLRVLPHPFHGYLWALMFLGLACLIPSLITKEGRNSRRTDRMLALMFGACLVSRLVFLPHDLTFRVSDLYTGPILALAMARIYVMVPLLAAVVLSFLFRLRAATWVLLAFVVVDVILGRVPFEPNNPQYIEKRAQMVAQQQAQAPQRGVQVVSATKTVRAGFSVWHYAFYAVALVYAFLLRRPSAPTTPQSETSEEQASAQEPRAP